MSADDETNDQQTKTTLTSDETTSQQKQTTTNNNKEMKTEKSENDGGNGDGDDHDDDDDDDDENNENMNYLFVHAKNLYLLLRDFCLFVEGNPSMWLNVNNVSQLFALELLDSILSAHSPLLIQYPQLVQIIEEKLCPWVSGNIFNPSASVNDFVLIVRCYRIASSILQYYYGVMVCVDHLWRTSCCCCCKCEKCSNIDQFID